MKLKYILKDNQKYNIKGDYPAVPYDVDVYDISDDKLNLPYIYFTNNGNVVGYLESSIIKSIKKFTELDLLIQIIDDMSEGVVVVNKDGYIIYTNDSYTTILGIKKTQIIGKNIKDIESEATIIEVLNTHKGLSKKNNYLKSIKRFIDVEIHPIFINNEFEGAYSIFSDITELKELNDKYSEISDLADSYIKEIKVKEKMSELNIIGKSPNYLRVIEKALNVSKTDASVLILGENGTGKDVLSQFIHTNSFRIDKPFIALNCSAIPESLIESEMFGYEGGSFTGSKRTGKLGKFEMADKGTIFLDEIADMSLPMQAKLLRVLETGEIEKIGSEKKHLVDVRVISATNKNIEKMVANGEFREDLYYRLSVVELKLPPIRERNHDNLLFINHFLEYYNKKYGKNLSFSKQALYYIINYDWPGNIREIKNCVEHCVILCDDKYIEVNHLPSKLTNVSEVKNLMSLDDKLKNTEEKYISDIYRLHNYDISETANHLGISKRTLYRKLNEYNIKEK